MSHCTLHLSVALCHMRLLASQVAPQYAHAVHLLRMKNLYTRPRNTCTSCTCLNKLDHVIHNQIPSLATAPCALIVLCDPILILQSNHIYGIMSRQSTKSAVVVAPATEFKPATKAFLFECVMACRNAQSSSHALSGQSSTLKRPVLKPPGSAYNVFTRKTFPDVKRKHPSKTYAEHSKILGQLWKEASQEVRVCPDPSVAVALLTVEATLTISYI
jgi:hypothetical protein